MPGAGPGGQGQAVRVSRQGQAVRVSQQDCRAWGCGCGPPGDTCTAVPQLGMVARAGVGLQMLAQMMLLELRAEQWLCLCLCPA